MLTIGAIKVSSNKTNDFGGRNSANIKQQLFNIQERKHFISSVRNKKNLENVMRWGDAARTRIKHLLTDILRRFCFMLASLLFQQRSVSQSIHDAIKVFLISFIAHDKISGKVCGTVGYTSTTCLHLFPYSLNASSSVITNLPRGNEPLTIPRCLKSKLKFAYNIEHICTVQIKSFPINLCFHFV